PGRRTANEVVRPGDGQPGLQIVERGRLRPRDVGADKVALHDVARTGDIHAGVSGRAANHVADRHRGAANRVIATPDVDAVRHDVRDDVVVASQHDAEEVVDDIRPGDLNPGRIARTPAGVAVGAGIDNEVAFPVAGKDIPLNDVAAGTSEDDADVSKVDNGN